MNSARCFLQFLLPLLVCGLFVGAQQQQQTTYCNICGQGNIIGQGLAILNFVDVTGTKRKFNCDTTQQLVNTENLFPSNSFCSYIYKIAVVPCACTTPSGKLIANYLSPTTTPVTAAPTPAATNTTSPSTSFAVTKGLSTMAAMTVMATLAAIAV